MSPDQPAAGYVFGVLQNSGQHYVSQYAAGVRLKTLEIGWDNYEPERGVWNSAYIGQRKAELQEMQAWGFQVVLDLGLQYPPAWAAAIQPFVNQYGDRRLRVNGIWSPAAREAIGTYVDRVFADLGTDFWGVRLGSGAESETLYPGNPSGRYYSYWAFDPDAAQTNPVPGWIPGQPSPNGEAALFYNWYLGRLIDYVNWQQAQVRRSYAGRLLQLMPGQGVRPSQYEALIGSNLTPYGMPIFAAERGAVWDRVIQGMAKVDNVVAYCSSLADGSGSNEESADPFHWSAAHWLAYNADRRGMAKMGENPGRNNAQQMQLAFDQMRRYGLLGLFWMSESQLYDTSGQYATIDDYARMIASASNPSPTQTPGGPTATPIGPTATPATCALSFADVPGDSPFYQVIRCLACRGIISGYADGSFRPGNDVTRGQLAKIVSSALGYAEPPTGQRFVDVPPDHTFYQFIERMAARGIIGGYADGTFRPQDNATRGQIAKIVSNAGGYADTPAAQSFADVPPDHAFYAFIERLAGRGIIGGYADGTFRPQNNATRGQIAKIVGNAFFPNCAVLTQP